MTAATSAKSAQLATIVARAPQSIAYPLTPKERSAYSNSAGPSVTDFQWSVYDIVKQIPAGTVSTYGDIAAHLHTSPRAVGTALKKNPFCPLVPCHRVVAASGQLGGFFGETSQGDILDTKARMLRDEGVSVVPSDKGAAWMIVAGEMKSKRWTVDVGE